MWEILTLPFLEIAKNIMTHSIITWKTFIQIGTLSSLVPEQYMLMNVRKEFKYGLDVDKCLSVELNV